MKEGAMLADLLRQHRTTAEGKGHIATAAIVWVGINVRHIVT